MSSNELTLSLQTISIVAIIYILFLLFIFSRCYDIYKNNRKKLAWVVTLVSSGVATIASTLYIISKSIDNERFMLFASGRDWFHSVDNYSALICLWIFVANIADLVFGFLYYREHLDPLTAYVHHTLYIWMMPTCTTGNGIFLTSTVFASAFCVGLVEELPTFLLALGYLFPEYRTDIGFGVTFFLLRILFHAYIFIGAILNSCETLLLVLIAVVLTMHSYWFYSWFVKYGAKYIPRKR